MWFEGVNNLEIAKRNSSSNLTMLLVLYIMKSAPGLYTWRCPEVQPTEGIYWRESMEALEMYIKGKNL